MSGLEKFQANEAWRAHIKKLLLTERKPEPPPSVPVSQSHRFSLDIAEDLQTILEEKIIPRRTSKSHDSLKRSSHQRNMYEELENDENRSLNIAADAQLVQQNWPGKSRFSHTLTVPNYCNDTVYDEQESAQWPRTSDESFEALEKMCNKTVSDPNSTLYKYWHSENKEQLVADVKKRSGDGKFQLQSNEEAKENDALERLLYELRVEEQTLLEDVSPLKGVEVTQLEDIEAPSKLWENTIVGDSSTALQTSPVKMVGLLRPSTIIEEGCEEFTVELEDEDLSSQLSFQSAVKSSEVSASCYETAQNSTNGSAAVEHRMLEISTAENASDFNNDPFAASAPAVELEESVDLINMDKTLQVASHVAQPSSGSCAQSLEVESSPQNESSNTDDSDCVIELLSDDENEENKAVSDQPMTVDELKLECSSRPIDAGNADSWVDVAAHIAAYEDDNKENCIYPDEDDEHSLHFNDTMEEVEYMMKKGMQYMAAAGASSNICTMTASTQTAALPAIVKELKTKENTFLLSPKKTDRYRSPSPMLHKQKQIGTTSVVKDKFSYASPKSGSQPTSVSKPKPQKRFALDIKPMPKLNVFKKPANAMPTNTGTRSKDTSNKHFPHIVSPVGAYMKKTGSTPLMTNFKQSSSENAHNATVFRELEYGTRVYQPKFEARPLVASNVPSLPKKAYISSEFKHIVDQRTPITIPGGKKIQKYLEGAMLPTVVRHEGKLKMAEAEVVTNTSNTATPAVCNRNASLANLSVMSGDISVYTMRDAQKF